MNLLIRYLERYIAFHDGGLYLCLNLCFAVGFSALDGLHFPFVALASFILAYPAGARYLWFLVVAYAQVFILIDYWRLFK